MTFQVVLRHSKHSEGFVVQAPSFSLKLAIDDVIEFKKCLDGVARAYHSLLE
jgi:hypothetical protein